MPYTMIALPTNTIVIDRRIETGENETSEPKVKPRPPI
jgi:hypothetical protein